jgi:hypothetical protein
MLFFTLCSLFPPPKDTFLPFFTGYCASVFSLCFLPQRVLSSPVCTRYKCASYSSPEGYYPPLFARGTNSRLIPPPKGTASSSPGGRPGTSPILPQKVVRVLLFFFPWEVARVLLLFFPWEVARVLLSLLFFPWEVARVLLSLLFFPWEVARVLLSLILPLGGRPGTSLILPLGGRPGTSLLSQAPHQVSPFRQCLFSYSSPGRSPGYFSSQSGSTPGVAFPSMSFCHRSSSWMLPP